MRNTVTVSNMLNAPSKGEKILCFSSLQRTEEEELMSLNFNKEYSRYRVGKLPINYLREHGLRSLPATAPLPLILCRLCKD